MKGRVATNFIHLKRKENAREKKHKLSCLLYYYLKSYLNMVSLSSNTHQEEINNIFYISAVQVKKLTSVKNFK